MVNLIAISFPAFPMSPLADLIFTWAIWYCLATVLWLRYASIVKRLSARALIVRMALRAVASGTAFLLIRWGSGKVVVAIALTVALIAFEYFVMFDRMRTRQL